MPPHSNQFQSTFQLFLPISFLYLLTSIAFSPKLWIIWKIFTRFSSPYRFTPGTIIAYMPGLIQLLIVLWFSCFKILMFDFSISTKPLIGIFLLKSTFVTLVHGRMFKTTAHTTVPPHRIPTFHMQDWNPITFSSFRRPSAIFPAASTTPYFDCSDRTITMRFLCMVS